MQLRLPEFQPMLWPVWEKWSEKGIVVPVSRCELVGQGGVCSSPHLHSWHKLLTRLASTTGTPALLPGHVPSFAASCSHAPGTHQSCLGLSTRCNRCACDRSALIIAVEWRVYGGQETRKFYTAWGSCHVETEN